MSEADLRSAATYNRTMARQEEQSMPGMKTPQLIEAEKRRQLWIQMAQEIEDYLGRHDQDMLL